MAQRIIQSLESLEAQRENVQTFPRVERPLQIVIPPNRVVKCPTCKEILYERDLKRNLKVCSKCNHHFRLTAYERIEMLVDEKSFVEIDANITSADPLQFISKTQKYAEKLKETQQHVKLNEAVV